MNIKGRLKRIEEVLNMTASQSKVQFYDCEKEYKKACESGKVNSNDVVFIDDIS